MYTSASHCDACSQKRTQTQQAQLLHLGRGKVHNASRQRGCCAASCRCGMPNSWTYTHRRVLSRYISNMHLCEDLTRPAAKLQYEHPYAQLPHCALYPSRETERRLAASGRHCVLMTLDDTLDMHTHHHTWCRNLGSIQASRPNRMSEKSPL